MTRKKRCAAIGAMLLLLLALCVPVFSGALAADENRIDIPIGQDTTVFDENGQPIGTIQPTQESGLAYQANAGDRITGVRVCYQLSAINGAKQNEALIGKAKVEFSLIQADEGEASEPTSTESTATLPDNGWIDSNLVITALSARISVDNSRSAALEKEIAALKQAATTETPITPEPTSTSEVTNDLNTQSTPSWVPFAALALGIVCAGALGWIALSAYGSKVEKKLQTEQLKKLNEHLARGIPIKDPLKMELNAWPRDARVEIVSGALDQMAKNDARVAAYPIQPAPAEPVKLVEPPPVPEGEEPDLLKLANSLAGVAASANWRAIVSEAGFRYVLLQANPTEKGTYIADESGYSIIAALMRGAEADVAYIVPSYHDPNASENRWHDFYAINESQSVRNYRVEALPVMFIERGVFFLPKSKGRLIRRP